MQTQSKNPQNIRIVGMGTFGTIYVGITGHAAIVFLLELQEGEVVQALKHSDVGHIDLVYGKTGINGYGLAHIQEKHPEMIRDLSTVIENGSVIKKIDDRMYLETPDGRAIIRLDWDGNKKSWVVTAYKT
jgi:hypothetical protein